MGRGVFPTTRRSILSRLPERSDEAWATFVSIYQPVAFRFARRAGLPPADAEELAATVMANFLTWFDGGDRYDPALGRFRSVFRTAVNREIGKALTRRGARCVSLDGVAEAVDYTADIEKLEHEEEARLVLDRFRASPEISDRDKTIYFELLAGADPGLLAKQYGVRRGTVHSIRSRCAKAIGELMDRILGADEGAS